MTEFEKYLQENKGKLEPDQVDKKVWLNIENALLKKRNKQSNTIIKIIIGLVFLLLGCFFFYSSNNKNVKLDENSILAEYDLTKYKFTEQVNTKKIQLVNATVPVDRVDDFQILLQQLEFMDGQFQDYRTYIEENGYQEFIGEQILNFYKSKIELLDKIQDEIEKINYYEKLQPTTTTYVGIEI